MMPIINPMIGSILIRHFEWNSVFLFMALYAAIMLLLIIYYLQETLISKNIKALNPVMVVRNFKEISINKVFLTYTAIGSISVTSLYGFLATASDLLIKQLNQDPTSFAWQFGIVMIGSLTGSYISSRLSLKLGINRDIKLGISITVISSISFLVLSLIGIFNVAAIIIPYTIQRLGEAMISAQSMAGSISPFPQTAGAASSLLGFLRQMTGACMAILVGYFADGTTLPLSIALVFGGVIPGLIFFRFYRQINL